MSWASSEGAPWPLGVSWVEEETAYNFAFYSKHAESVTLLLYAEEDLIRPVFTYRLDPLRNKSGRIWHCRVPGTSAREARYYAYSVGGPAPAGRFEYHRFEPEKVLLDPHAWAIYFPKSFDRRAAIEPGSNAGRAPLGSLCACRSGFDWGDDRRPHHESQTVIYELHVKGFTASPSSGLGAETRGTYAGLIEKIPYLAELGVTAVELMPVFQYDPQEGNYWGYLPLSFFAPHHAYATAKSACACEQHNEFRSMVKALHAAGIEVLLDVVYNHTGEGDAAGPTYSYKGIDNSTYYLVSADPLGAYSDFSGTGNTLNCANRHVRRMILESMHHWVRSMHVDGFRFDLASIFGRTEDGSVNWDEPSVLGDVTSHRDMQEVRLIAEPWDAAGIYQLGRSFPGRQWLQWNGKFRDDVRRFVRGDPGMVPALMSRLYGSDDLFPDDLEHAYHAYQSVNYVTCHDGFTLYDLVSYSRKRNWANWHANVDGADENYSWNCGFEGDGEAVPEEVLELRKRQAKNFCCLLSLANGTPLLRAGDEFLQTQQGNNNPYNQDNETSWLDWSRLETHRDVFRFFKSMIGFRKAHPSLCRSRFWREDVRWYGQGPAPDLSPSSRSLAFCLHGQSQGDLDLYAMINASPAPLSFTIQEGLASDWRRVVDTALPSPRDFLEPGSEARLESVQYLVQARSVVVLIGSGASGLGRTIVPARAPGS